MHSKVVVLSLAAIGIVHGGPVAEFIATAPANEPWLTPKIDIRSRYEFGDVDLLDPSHAFTFRERLGLQTAAWNGFSAFVEGEFSQAAIDDYNGGTPLADPAVARNTIIADPETNELNQAYLQYEGFDTTTKAGRQKIIYDNAAFIGNVGWRQNEQTYDALSFSNKSIDKLTLNYAYLNQVNRIFGSDADSPLAPGFASVEDIATSTHLFNTSYTGFEGLTLGGYAYIMNFEDVSAWDNNTFGVTAKKDLLGLLLYGEVAWQDKAGLVGSEEALYVHTTATKSLGSHSFTLGVEHLDAGFKTPLATVHAFNGFADATDAARLSGSHNGLTDTYLTHSMPIFWGMKWANTLHAMGDNEISAGYGWEIDSVLTKKFNSQLTGLAKVAHFESEGDGYVGAAGLPTTTRLSVELGYTF